MKSFDFWWRLLRPHTLTASLIPVILGSIYAYTVMGWLRLDLLAAMLFASVLIQTATNLFNEYYDYVRGLDTKDSVGIGGTIVHDGASPKFVLFLALGIYLVAMFLGIYICWQTSWTLALIGAGFMLIGYLYTGGPFPISASPFGEIFAGLSLGAGVICIAYYIQQGFVTWECFWLSIPIVLLIGLILTANNIRDRVGDAQNGRKTLVILLGHRNAVRFMTIIFVVAYLWPLFMIVFYQQTSLLFLSWLSLPKAISAVKGFHSEGQTPKEMMPAMKAVAQTNTFYGLLYAFGLLASYYLGEVAAVIIIH